MSLEPLRRTAKTVGKIISPRPLVDERVATLGTAGSGKTTFLACFHMTCLNLANNPDQNFLYRPREGSTGIREAQSNLREGKFPARTPVGMVFEATLMLKWRTMAGTRQVQVPICETAGEEIAKFIDRFSQGQYDLNPTDFRHATQLHDYILRSSGFIVVAPVSRVAIEEGKRIETEPKKLSADPDVNIARLLECVYDYKERTGSTPIKAIAVLLTKYDLWSKFLEAKGMDLTRNVGVQKFMNLYFPETYNILKYYGINKVTFFPTWVELETDPKTGKLIPFPDADGKENFKIRVMSDRRIPYYSEPSYVNLVQWVRENFAS